MSKNNNFYNNKDRITFTQKRIIWNGIRSELRDSLLNNSFYFDWKNYTLGVATCILLILAGLGIRSIIIQNKINQQSEISLLNSTYYETTNRMEKIVSKKLFDNSVKDLDELLQAKEEQLSSVNNAILEIKQNQDLKNYESVRDKRLRQLYIMKLQILDNIIAMEGGIK